MNENKLIKGAIITGFINAIINGGIQYFILKDGDVIPISVDSISNNIPTVLGTAVSLAISLSILLTIVAFFSIKEKKVPFFPKAFWLTIKHGFFTFGVITSLSVLWQKNMGTIEVSLLTGIIIIGVIEEMILAIVRETNEDKFQKIGKNIYITNNVRKVRLTINSYTNRIITADKLNKKNNDS